MAVGGGRLRPAKTPLTEYQAVESSCLAPLAAHLHALWSVIVGLIAFQPTILPVLLRWAFKQLSLHVDLAQFRQTSAQLQKGLHAFQNAHMGEANFFDELEFRMFRKGRDCLGHSEHSAYDVV